MTSSTGTETATSGASAETQIAEDVYLTDDERVIVYERDRTLHTVLDDPETELETWLSGDAYIQAMNALGLKPVIDL